MAIKVTSQTVINNSFALENVAEFEGLFTNFHPLVNAITTDIDFTKPFVTLAMTSNVTFTTSNRNTGKQVTLLLDTSTTPYAPTWPSEVKFPTTITWSSNRFWTVTFTCWDASTVRATALPYDAAGTPAAAFDNFSLQGWNVFNIHYAISGFPESWAYVLFKRDDSNNRIIITRAHGDSGAPGTYVDVYANYTGLTGISSVEVQYNVQSQVCSGDCIASNYTFGPTPVSDGYNSGTYYTVPNSPGGIRFGWMAQASPNSFAYEEATTQANMQSGNPDFRIKIVCNEGTFYSTAECPAANIYLQAYIGDQARAF